MWKWQRHALCCTFQEGACWLFSQEKGGLLPANACHVLGLVEGTLGGGTAGATVPPPHTVKPWNLLLKRTLFKMQTTWGELLPTLLGTILCAPPCSVPECHAVLGSAMGLRGWGQRLAGS